MVSAKRKKPEKYSYADYLKWNDDKRYEIIDGDVYDMTGPTLDHQVISGELFRQIANFLEDKPCRVLHAPFDLMLARQNKKAEEITTVLQPDIMVVCDEKKITQQGVFGAPDLVVEIISPSTASRDNILKRSIYEKAGVKEFWLVHPVDRLVRIYRLGKDGLFGREDIYDHTATIGIKTLPGLTIDAPKLFAGIKLPAHS